MLLQQLEESGRRPLNIFDKILAFVVSITLILLIFGPSYLMFIKDFYKIYKYGWVDNGIFTELETICIQEESICCVCDNNENTHTNQLIRLSCNSISNHIICQECYNNWFTISRVKKCPICRQYFTFNECKLIKI